MDLSKKIISSPIEIQCFPFLPSFMNYIIQNSSPKLLLKLYQCCKFFYFKAKITIALSVWYYHKEKEIEFEFYGKDGKSFYRVYPNTEKLWLYNKLRIISYSDIGLIGNVLFNKIYRNNLKRIYVGAYFILIKDLEILSKSPYLTQISLETTVKNDNNEPIPIEEIMGLFPNMKKFTITPPHFTMKTFQKLLKFRFSNKIKLLELCRVKTEFEPITMCKFLQDNLDKNSQFKLTFNSDHLENQLLPRVKEIIDGWEKKPKYLYFGY